MGKSRRRKVLIVLALAFIIVLVSLVLILPKAETIDSIAFMEKLENNQIKLIELTTGSDEVRGEYKNGRSFYTEAPNNTSPRFLENIKKHKVEILLDYRLLK